MNNKYLEKTRKLSFALIALLSITMLFSLTAYAAPEDEEEPLPDPNVTVEYRFAEGQTITVPPTINQLGREYKLLSQTPPALESSLPITRTYTYRIDGAVSPSDLALVDALDYLDITPVYRPNEREVNKDVVIENLPNNEVAIPELAETRVFSVTSATSTSGYEDKSLTRAEVKFEVTEYEMVDLPVKYTASTVYRGVETFNELAYYLAETTYQTSRTEGTTNQYIVVATYEPVDIPPATPINEPEETEDVILGGDIVDTGGTEGSQGSDVPLGSVELSPAVLAEFDADDIAMIESQTGNPITDIANGNVPLGSAGAKSVWSALSFILSIIAVILAIVTAVGTIIDKTTRSVFTDSTADEAQYRKLLMKVLAIIAGVATLATWLILDDLSTPLAWINIWTPVVVVIFVASVVLFVISLITSKNTSSIDETPVADSKTA